MKNNIKSANLEDFIFLINQQLSESINCKITNIKLSFIHKFSSNTNEIIFYESLCLIGVVKHILVVSYDEYKYTFLGRNKEHLNITGIKSFLNIEKAITGLTNFTNLKLCNFKNFAIDNISSTYKTYPGLKKALLHIKDENFKILKPTRFCGIIIKYNRSSLTYFNSGSVILVGLKNIADLNLYIKKYNDFLKYCLTHENSENEL